MAIIVGDSTDGVRTGLAGRIANAIVAVFATVGYAAGTNHQKGVNALVQGFVDAFNNDQIDPFSQVASSLPMLGANTAAGQSITSGVSTIVVFGTVERDSDSAYNSSTGRFTVPTGKGGDYLITSSIMWNTAPAGNAVLEIFKNATAVKTIAPQTSVALDTFSITAILNLAPGDIIDIRPTQVSGGPVALTATAARNWLAIKCLSRT